MSRRQTRGQRRPVTRLSDRQLARLVRDATVRAHASEQCESAMVFLERLAATPNVKGPAWALRMHDHYARMIVGFFDAQTGKEYEGIRQEYAGRLAYTHAVLSERLRRAAGTIE